MWICMQLSKNITHNLVYKDIKLIDNSFSKKWLLITSAVFGKF